MEERVRNPREGFYGSCTASVGGVTVRNVMRRCLETFCDAVVKNQRIRGAELPFSAPLFSVPLCRCAAVSHEMVPRAAYQNDAHRHHGEYGRYATNLSCGHERLAGDSRSNASRSCSMRPRIIALLDSVPHDTWSS